MLIWALTASRGFMMTYWEGGAEQELTLGYGDGD